jgi:hypothetical protein
VRKLDFVLVAETQSARYAEFAPATLQIAEVKTSAGKHAVGTSPFRRANGLP